MKTSDNPFGTILCPIAVCLVLLGGWAQTADAATRVALAPLETLGAKSNAAQRTRAAIARAVARVPGIEVVSGQRVQRALAKFPALKNCHGAVRCLAQLGRAVAAKLVVYGEVGGLGEIEIVYLKVIDVATAKELRSTTVDLAGQKGQEMARAAAVELLAPDRYVGRLDAQVDVDGASIYVDGTKVANSPSQPIPLPVGPHALRVTHPEFRDFVRFVDVSFDTTAEVRVAMQQYPVVTSDIARDGPSDQSSVKTPPTSVVYRGVEPTPWYRRWYSVAAFGTAVLVVSAIAVGFVADGIDADSVIDVNNPASLVPQIGPK